ncbi:HpcH/HpaI aldolase/citrate lyase family protein [Aminobacter aminovorans]|uniref:Citrate lyase beta subunit n=1 Tax=Aminobacter aminovorans TaxID=83263 RepID=A0A380WRG0_AMIAI|nr:HpcH/HpaI aldolase/citrate lyase family protein [Aminobacter aminovorans]SUU91513.1 Citrate lyase beta subunit [Aminobacter aminovorans]
MRVNPVNAGTTAEIETVLGHGAQVLMLPYFRTAGEVETFVRLVDGRAAVMILVETASALVRIREILAVPGVCEVMVGLNDLRLELGVRNHFEVLVSPLMDAVAREVRAAKLPFSIGGVGRVDDVSLPVSPNLVLAQYARLGATGAWISRSFFECVPADWDFGDAVASIRRRLTEWADASPEALEQARDELSLHARLWR